MTADKISVLNELDIILESMPDAEFNEITNKVKSININKTEIMNELKNWKCYFYKGVEYFKNSVTGEKKTADQMVDFSPNMLNEIRQNSARLIPIPCNLRPDQIKFFSENNNLNRNEVVRECLDVYIYDHKKLDKNEN